MSTKEAREPKEPKHRPDALRLPQRKDSLTQVLTYLQGKTIPPRPASTASSPSTQSAPASLTQGLSKPRRHSHGPDAKKKARNSLAASKRHSFSNLAGILEESGTKTKAAKTSEGAPGTPKTAKSASSEKVNKTNRIKSQSQPAGGGQEPKTPSSPPPMPKSILRVSSPDGARPPPRHIRSYSASAANPGPGQFANATGLTPISPTDPSFPGLDHDPDAVSQPTSPVFRPLSPGATVRFAKATIHRVDVGPGRRFMPVKRRSKSTMTYIAPLDPVSQSNSHRFTLQSPTKLRRHQENQAAMGRYWLRTEEEEAQSRAELERQAAEEAERYRAEPSSPVKLPERPSWAERLTILDKLPSLDSIPALDKTESPARSDAEDKLETVVASDSDDSDAESDGGASTAMDKDDDTTVTESETTAEGKKEAPEPDDGADVVLTAASAAPSAEESLPAGTPISAAGAMSNVSPTAPSQAPSQQTEPLKANPAVGNPAAAKPASEMAQGTTAAAAEAPEPAPATAGASRGTTQKPELTEAETPQAQAASVATSTTRTVPPTPASPARAALEHQSTQSLPGPERPVSRPSSPALKHKKSMASLTASPGSNHLHLSGRRTRRYLGEHKQEIMA